MVTLYNSKFIYNKLPNYLNIQTSPIQSNNAKKMI